MKEIRNGAGDDEIIIPHTAAYKVSEILRLLETYKNEYQEKGVIPALNNRFEINLFNTFRCYMDIENYFPSKFKQNIDPRGAFVEVIRLNVGGQVSFSTTVPELQGATIFIQEK